MKTFHIMDLAEFHAVRETFHPQGGAHYIDLPSGKILVAARFADESAEEHFHARATGKIDLPHPAFSGNQALSADHVEHLAHLFEGASAAEKKATAGKANIHEVVKRAAKIHPLMRLSAF